MDPLSLCLALLPVAVYLLVLGLVHMPARPLLTSGFRDGATLAVAISGLAIVGPLRLFVPEVAAYRYGGLVWPMLLALYWLAALLWLLTMRPRLVVYNITIDQLRPVLAALAQQLDDQARWAGDSLWLPHLGVRLHVESSPVSRTVQLVSAGASQDFAGWRRLERELGPRLNGVSAARGPRGAGLVATGLAVMAIIAVALVTGQHTVAQEVSELLRIR